MNPWIRTCPECGHEEKTLLCDITYRCSICGYTRPKESDSQKKVNHPTNFPDITFHDKLKTELQSIKTWELFKGYDRVKGYNLECAVSIFMNNLAHLYLDYFQYHPEEAKTIAIGFTDELLLAAGVLFDYYVLSELNQFETTDAWDCGWHEVCWTATTIKIFDDLFGDIASRIEATAFWDFVEKYRYNSWVYPEREKIPQNVPYDHWWWFTKYDFEGKAKLLDKKNLETEKNSSERTLYKWKLYYLESILLKICPLINIV